VEDWTLKQVQGDGGRQCRHSFPSIILRHPDVDALPADGGDARQDREPAGDLIFDQGRRIAAGVGDDLDIDPAAEIFAGGDRRALTGGDVGGDDSEAVGCFASGNLVALVV
jgi:hypothetical protein